MKDSKIIEVLKEMINESDIIVDRTGTTTLYKKHSERSLALGLAIANINHLHLVEQELTEQEFTLWYFPPIEIFEKHDIMKVRKCEGTKVECIEKRTELMERFETKKDRFIIEIKTD
jgi:hypothetical protein